MDVNKAFGGGDAVAVYHGDCTRVDRAGTRLFCIVADGRTCSVVLFFGGVERWNKCIDRVQLSGKESCI